MEHDRPRKTTLVQSCSRGFTLIELIVVIVILGILAAVALPRFVDLSGDAEKAAVQSTYGAIQSARTLYIAKALTCGDSYRATNTPLAFFVWTTTGGTPQCSAGNLDSGKTFDGNVLRNGLMANPSADIFKDNLDNGNIIEFVTKTGRTVTITLAPTTGIFSLGISPPY